MDNAKIAPELEYILKSCKAVTNGRYDDSLQLLREGLRENFGIAGKIDSAEFITLLRALVTVIEVKFEKDMKNTRNGVAQYIMCSFCGKSQSDVWRIIKGETGAICNECIKTCSQMLNNEDGYEIDDTGKS